MENKGEIKNCQNCKNDFMIEPDDFLFYEKIKVPAPTWCPECRMVRRLSWRNERILYHRICDSCNKKIISVINNKETKVYCQDCWRGDSWDPSSYFLEYNFSS